MKLKHVNMTWLASRIQLWCITREEERLVPTVSLMIISDVGVKFTFW